jgi:hypothetical protein
MLPRDRSPAERENTRAPGADPVPASSCSKKTVALSTKAVDLQKRMHFAASMSTDQAEVGASAADDDFRVAVAANELHGSVLPSLDHPQVDPRFANAQPSKLQPAEPPWQAGSIQREAIFNRVGQEAQHARH